MVDSTQTYAEETKQAIANAFEPVDMAELFLAPERTDAVIDQAVAENIPVLWLQIGVINEAGAERAEQAGLKVVMDRCPKREIPRLKIAS